MFSFTFRRLALHASRGASPLQARNASGKTTLKSVVNAIKDPAPPVLARFPRVYWAVSRSIQGFGLYLGGHIFVEYFYSVGESYGISMLPTINSMGDWLIISKYYRRGRGVEVGDLVSFKHPIQEHARGAKRVIGMPGDFVLRDSPGTSDLIIQIPDGHCYVVGDNLQHSRDSRMFGPLPLALIKGRVIGRFSTQNLRPEFFSRGLKNYEAEDDVD